MNVSNQHFNGDFYFTSTKCKITFPITTQITARMTKSTFKDVSKTRSKTLEYLMLLWSKVRSVRCLNWNKLTVNKLL